jgi:hypothetical protein
MTRDFQHRGPIHEMVEIVAEYTKTVEEMI